MLSLEVANGPLLTFSICYFEHLFHRLIRSQPAAAVMEEKKSEELSWQRKDVNALLDGE